MYELATKSHHRNPTAAFQVGKNRMRDVQDSTDATQLTQHMFKLPSASKDRGMLFPIKC
jgi:hypothetical protein